MTVITDNQQTYHNIIKTYLEKMAIIRCIAITWPVPPAILGFNLEAYNVSNLPNFHEQGMVEVLAIQQVFTTCLSGAPNEPRKVSHRIVD